MEIPLVAGRFAPLAGRFALDLATGERVYLGIETTRHADDDRAWVERCTALCGVWQPHLAECLDFGALGTSHRFAAFAACRHLLPGPPMERWRLLRPVVEAFLSACAIEVGTRGIAMSDADDRPLVLPAVATNDEPAGDAVATLATMSWFGVRFVSRPVLAALVEYLTVEVPSTLAVLRIEAPHGSGGRTLLRACAREARRHGYVPLSTGTLRWIESQPGETAAAWTMALARHNLVVLHDGRQRPFNRLAEVWAPLLRMSGRHARTRLVLELTALGGPPTRFRLTPLAEEELAGAIVTSDRSCRFHERVLAAARRARGRPGPFVQAAGDIIMRRRPRRLLGYTVHERATSYGEPVSVPSVDGGPSSVAIQAPMHPRAEAADDHAVRGALQSAARHAGRGRHAAAERALRQAQAMALRRRLWVQAAHAAVRRADIRACRGDPSAAERLLLEALEFVERTAVASGAAAILTRIGLLQLEDGRIEQSESTLRAGAATAALLGDHLLQGWLASALAECLWWQGRHDEARAVLAGCADPDVDGTQPDQQADDGLRPPATVVAAKLAAADARVCLSLAEEARARGHIVRALGAARALDPAMGAVVRRLEARWHAAVGDSDGFAAATKQALRLAVAARRPLDRLRAMAGYVEGCMRLHAAGDCPRVVRCLEAAARRRLPGLLALRVRMATGLYRGSISLERARAECAARRLSGLIPAVSRPFAQNARSPMYEDVVEVLGICQEEEPAAALTRVVDIVRARTRAAVVELASECGLIVLRTPRGARPSAVARRAVESGAPIAPGLMEGGTEAAVPLRFGGAVVGALACRWLDAVPLEASAVMGLLGAVSAASAPALHAALEQHRPPATGVFGDIELIGESAAMQEVRRAIARAAHAPFPVLIQGESGSGKELVARAIHRAGGRRARVFCALNCAALPDDLLEAELFGHARGAFTGAVAERSGLFEQADGGVLFLDEVGELTPRGQAKLLRAIQEGEIKRLGETFARKVDVRIIAATNRPLEQEVAAGRFRGDLRYRLDVIRIGLPPLRDRADDIPLLAQSLWRAAASRVGSRAVLGGAVLAALARYDWPGNVRELQNVLAALAVAAPRHGTVGAGALPAMLATIAVRGSATTLEEARRVFEERYVRAALARAGGHRGRAAAELGVTRQGLAKLMGRLGVTVSESAAAPSRAL